MLSLETDVKVPVLTVNNKTKNFEHFESHWSKEQDPDLYPIKTSRIRMFTFTLILFLTSRSIFMFMFSFSCFRLAGVRTAGLRSAWKPKTREEETICHSHLFKFSPQGYFWQLFNFLNGHLLSYISTECSSSFSLILSSWVRFPMGGGGGVDFLAVISDSAYEHRFEKSLSKCFGSKSFKKILSRKM